MATSWNDSPSARVLRARAAALTKHSRYDTRESTASAHKASLARFEKAVDPEGTLSPEERARRTECAKPPPSRSCGPTPPIGVLRSCVEAAEALEGDMAGEMPMGVVQMPLPKFAVPCPTRT